MTTGNIKFSQLPNLPAANITAATIAPVVENNINYKVTLANLTSYINNSGNITATTVSASGNITGAYFIGNGSQLTGIVSSYGNANVTALLASGNVTSNVITTGNVTGNYIFGNGSQLTGLPATYGNANVAANLAAFGSNPISTSGNITAGNFAGNGAALTGVTATLPANITGTSLSVTGNATAAFFVGNGSALTGITGTYSNAAVAAYLASGTNTSNIITSGNVSGAYIIGNGSALSNIAGANVTGTVANATLAANATYATSAGTATSATTATSAATATSATTAVTVTSASQPAITSVGTLTSLSSTGNITANYFLGNGSQLTGITAPAGNSIVSGNSFANVAVANGKVWINGGNVIGYYNQSNVTGLTSNTMIITNGASNAYITLAGSGDIVVSAAQNGTLSSGNVYLGTLRIQGASLANPINGTFSGTVDTNALTVNANAVVYGTLSVSGKTTLGPYVQTVSVIGNTSTSVVPNANTAPVLKFTVNNNFTLGVPTNMTTGQSLTLIFTQDATGNRVMTANTAYKFAYGVNTLSTTASTTDVLTVFYDGTNYLTNLIKGYA